MDFRVRLEAGNIQNPEIDQKVEKEKNLNIYSFLGFLSWFHTVYEEE